MKRMAVVMWGIVGLVVGCRGDSMPGQTTEFPVDAALVPGDGSAADAPPGCKVWDATFDEDPTTVDGNGDGLPDWRMPVPMDPGELQGGTWTPTLGSHLETYGMDVGDGTLHARLQVLDLDAAAQTPRLALVGSVQIAPDEWSRFDVVLTADGPDATHLRLLRFVDGEKGWIGEDAHVETIPTHAVDIDVVFHPAASSLVLSIDGQQRGPLSWASFYNQSELDTVAVHSWGTDHRIEHLRAMSCAAADSGN